MTDEINLPTQAARPASAPMDPMAIWASIERMAMNPDVDPAKFTALVSAQGAIMDRACLDGFTRAKNAVMAEMPRVRKDKSIVHSGKLIGKFGNYEDLRAAIDPVLLRHNMRLAHDPGFSDTMKMPTMSAVLTWADGPLSYIERGSPMVIPFDSGGAKSGAQSAGSSATYGQRYTTVAILGIVMEGGDNDGNGDKQLEKELSVAQTTLVEDSRMAASQGADGYRQWFMEKSKADRAFLVEHPTNPEDPKSETQHEANKKSASDVDKLRSQ